MPLARASVRVIGNIQGDFSKVIKLLNQFARECRRTQFGKFHRDIKPRNALIMSDGNIKIADFGLAKFEKRDSSTHTSSNDFLGTFGYHAPEQFEAKNSDARTDVFQLGKCFYEMFTSDYPYLINSKKIPSGLAYIIQKATSPDPDDRFQSVSDFLQAIKSYEKSLNPKQNPKDALENKILEIKKLLDGLYRKTSVPSYLIYLVIIKKTQIYSLTTLIKSQIKSSKSYPRNTRNGSNQYLICTQKNYLNISRVICGLLVC